MGRVIQMKPEQGLFCVQQHNSKKPHYDLRIEHNGMARSWCMYKPFSITGELRLAVKMPPHTVKYLTKEADDCKIVVLGTCRILSWEENRMKFELNAKTESGEIVKGCWVLERTKKGRSFKLYKLN